jgi:hypothetical protein
MTDKQREDRGDSTRQFDGSFDGTRRRQILAGLALDPAGRLRWLERTLEELRRFEGRAK